MRPVTVTELAAFLGLTASGLRNVIHRKGIAPVGKHGKANLYDAAEVMRHAGTHDRRSA